MLTAPRYGQAFMHDGILDVRGPFFGVAHTHTVPGITALAWPTSDLAIYVPVRVKQPQVVYRLHAGVGAASGNIDIGLYDAAGVRLVSTGTTAATSNGMTLDVTDTFIRFGLHYLAFVADNTTITMIGDNDAAPLASSMGLLQEQLGAGAALPATATWAVGATSRVPVLAAICSGNIT